MHVSSMLNASIHVYQLSIARLLHFMLLASRAGELVRNRWRNKSKAEYDATAEVSHSGTMCKKE